MTEAGRELDILIAEKVMEWEPRVVGEYPFGDGEFTVYDGPNGECFQPDIGYEFSTDISAAWKVVNKMCAEKGGDMELICYFDGEWGCWFSKELPNMGGSLEWAGRAYATTAPLAICHAALNALSVHT